MKKIVLFTLFFSLCWPVGSAFAQQTAITVIPPSQEVQLTQGQDYAGAITVRNRTDLPNTVTITAVDFVVNDTNGTPVFVSAAELTNRFAAASWVELPQKTVTIQPKQEAQIPYIVHTPTNATPGGHYVSLVVKNVSTTLSTGSGAAVQIQVASLLSLSVDGPITEKATVNLFSVPAFQEYGPIDGTMLITNNGDLHITPQGSIQLVNMFGRDINTFTLPDKHIFPDASRIYSFHFGNSLLFGPYSVRLDATYGKNNANTLVATATIWIIPWKILIITVLALIALILAIMLIRKKNPPLIVEVTQRPSPQPQNQQE